MLGPTAGGQQPWKRPGRLPPTVNAAESPRSHRKGITWIEMSTPGQQTRTQAFEAALAEFQSELKPKDKSMFRNTTYSHVANEIEGIQTRLMQQRRGKNLMRLKSFLEAIEQFGKIVEVFGNASLLIAFVWASRTLSLPILIIRMCCS